MAKKTPEERIAELDAKRAKVEEKLRAEKEAIVQAKRREQAKILNRKRKDDTRRKILIGAMHLNGLAKLAKEQQSAEKRRLREKMAKFLTRKDDRVLFGLAPLPENKTSQN